MKKKLFLAIVAVVLVTAIVGSAFALYIKNATQRSIELTTGDGVTLSLDSTEAFSLTQLKPGANQTQTVTLTATNVAKVESWVSGLFTVTVTAASAADADVALAAAIDVNASGTDYSATKAQLAAGSSVAIIASREITLTFSIGEEAFLGGAAEGTVNVAISYVYVDNWTIDDDGYYIVGTMTGWAEVTKSNIKLSTAAADLGESDNTAVIRNIHFNAGDEFKIVKGSTSVDSHWYSLLGGASVTSGAISIGTGESAGNAVVNTSGDYCIYQNGSGFYVGPYPEA